MKRLHMPVVDARYWLAITLASIFGTNLGDLYAHETGLGIVPGIAILSVIAALAFVAERADRRAHQAYYWFVIIVIRTGATNIADYLAFRVHVPAVPLAIGLAALIALFAWRSAAARPGLGNKGTLPATGWLYWAAMLSAGVFGTVLGDVCSHFLGEGVASLMLGALLALVFVARRRVAATGIGLYWLTVATARTTGTAMGDWFAENDRLNIGLPLSTLITGTAFVAVLLLWRSRRGATA